MFTHIYFLAEVIKYICMAFKLNGHLVHNLKQRLILVNEITIIKKEIAMRLTITLKIMQLKFDQFNICNCCCFGFSS